MARFVTFCLLIAFALAADATRAQALTGPVNFVVLRVTFADFPAGSRFTAAQTQTNFNNITTLWDTDSSYGNISPSFQIAGPYQVAQPSTTYLDIESGQSSSISAMLQLLGDAVDASPSTINWTNVYGVILLFSDPRPEGFYRGITYPGTTLFRLPHVAVCPHCYIHVSIVGENPSEGAAQTWGRWAHEIGHQMQANPGNPWHPSNYNSDFELMDAEFPAQSGVFNKQSNIAYPGWLPVSKYKLVSPPAGASVGLYAEEQPPATQPDFQAIRAFLTFGGTSVYYLVSVRHNILGDDTATTHGPNGIPDNGVLIERVVEGGDPAILDNGLRRWVNVENNGSSPNTLWHAGDTYHSTTDGIYITVVRKSDDDHYQVDVRYADQAGQPDAGLQSWLQPPGNTYETTDIWIDSPVNTYGTYRYPIWSDLLGGTVPSGNGDDPAVGQVNRFYARVRNYGSMPAANVVVHFDMTDPPGVGIAGSNGFVELGAVASAQFPGLALIAPNGYTDVYYEWTPNFTLTPEQIIQGRFNFHTCVRVRLDHAVGETFFANQDGDGQQENIDHFQAISGGGGGPGAPGPPNRDTIRLRNDSRVASKQFALSVLRETLPSSWKVNVNDNNPVVTLAPNEVRDVPVVMTQTQREVVGTHYTMRVFASSEVTLHNASRPTDLHTDLHVLGGVQFQAAVLGKTSLACKSIGNGVVEGKLSGVAETGYKRLPIEVVGVERVSGKVAFSRTVTYGYVGQSGGHFKAVFGAGVKTAGLPEVIPKHAVCLFAGTTNSTSAGSAIFAM